MNWPPVFHLQWLVHVPHVRQHLPTTIVWNSPMRELIGSVMVSSLLLPTFGTFSLPLYFKNTKNLFIHIALIPEGDNPRVNPNILKCLLHSPVARGYRLVVIASRAMVCKTPTYYLILNSLAFARGCVILQLTHSLSSFAYFAFISSYLTLIILSEVL